MKTPGHEVVMAFSLGLLVLFAVCFMVSIAFCVFISVSEFWLMDWVRLVSPVREEMVGAPAWACSGGQSLFCLMPLHGPAPVVSLGF